MAPGLDPLPIDAVLDDLVEHLRRGANAVLIAPPGAGKTTRVPGAVLDHLVESPLRVLVLEPRRLAARLAAKRIAAERSTRVGAEVGYQVRFDDRTSDRTRIAFLTEGILTRRLQSDPLLEGVGAVILDEFHERSIHADLSLAFLREIQETVRPDLRIIVMSATLDPEPVSRFLGGAPVVKSDGRLFPVTVHWTERPDDRPPVTKVVSGVRRALREGSGDGDVLAFLPGAHEIRRVKEELEGLLADDIEVCPLYGELSAELQDRAVEPGPRRKVILATNIAESSLTIEGVTVVVDSGLVKIARHDPALGIDRLELTRIGARSAEQRSGRAGRLRPGVAYRLWTEKEHRNLPSDALPEIARVDLAPVLLDVLRWSRGDPRDFGWFESPPAAMLDRAEHLLRRLGALEPDGFALTDLGDRLASFPLHPRLAMILVRAHELGILEEGAWIAALASERDVLRRSGAPAGRDEVGASDLLMRVDRVRSWLSGGASRGAAAALELDGGAARNAVRVRDRLQQQAERILGRPPSSDADHSEEAALRVILAGFPDRVARRIEAGGDRVLLAEGGGAIVSRESVVKDGELLVAVQVEGGDRKRRREGLVRIASRIERSWLAERLQRVPRARFNGQRSTAEAVVELRYGDLVLETKPSVGALPDALSEVLAEAARADIDRALPLTDDVVRFLARYDFLRREMPELSLEPMDAGIRVELLGELCVGRRSFAELQALDLSAALEARLPREARGALARHAPLAVPIPSGRKAALRYEPEGPPVLSVRLQEVFGLYDTPCVAAGRVPVTMELLAPNRRPVQITRDLRSFWASTYAEVRKELRRRYPKHQWPEDPRQGVPSARTKKQLGRGR